MADNNDATVNQAKYHLHRNIGTKWDEEYLNKQFTEKDTDDSLITFLENNAITSE